MKRYTNNIFRFISIKRLNNNKGTALILSYLVLSVLFTLSSGIALTTYNELSNAKRYKDSTDAFWKAEAGINQFIGDQTLLNDSYVTTTKDDSDPLSRIVSSTATVKGVTRGVAVEFPSNPPDIFNNTMSSGGNLYLNGLVAKLEVFGPTRLTGSYTKNGIGASGWFEDKQEGISSDETTFTYPDADENGTPDEFNDFVEFNRELVASYPSEEVVYIQSDATQVIIPNGSLVGKKVIFVEGSTPGSGDVDIIFDATWQSDQNLTVISTGDVDYVQPLQVSEDSQLNIVSWDTYDEGAILYSSHDGVTYSHNEANFYSIFAYSETTGNLIVNNDINTNEALAWKRFNYGNPLVDGEVPPGFEGLVGQAQTGYSSTPNSWREI